MILHTSRPVYTKNVYNVRIYAFYYLTWRHLVNTLPRDNETLKLKHKGLHSYVRRIECSESGGLCCLGTLQGMIYHWSSLKSVQKLTRSPAVARMADRTATQQTIYAKAVAHSCSNDMDDNY